MTFHHYYFSVERIFRTVFSSWFWKNLLDSVDPSHLVTLLCNRTPEQIHCVSVSLCTCYQYLSVVLIYILLWLEMFGKLSWTCFNLMCRTGQRTWRPEKDAQVKDSESTLLILMRSQSKPHSDIISLRWQWTLPKWNGSFIAVEYVCITSGCKGQFDLCKGSIIMKLRCLAPLWAPELWFLCGENIHNWPL